MVIGIIFDFTIESWKKQAMPQISERELVERVSPLDPEMKLLNMSGYTEDIVVHHRVLDKATAFIQKPFTPADLVGKARQVLDGFEKIGVKLDG